MKISLESKVIKIFYINLKGRASDSINFYSLRKTQRLNANHKLYINMLNKPRKKERNKKIIIIKGKKKRLLKVESSTCPK